jgi:protein transport protein SEC24
MHKITNTPFSNNVSSFHHTVNENIIQPSFTSPNIEYKTTFDLDFLKFTSETIPSGQYLIKNSGIPFGAHFTPFPASLKEDNNTIPKYSFANGNGKISRCHCGTFLNPYCTLDTSTWKCNICEQNNPRDAQVDSTLKNIINGSTIYDIYANSDYIERTPISPNYVFVIDTTHSFLKTGALTIVNESLKYIVENQIIQNEDRAYIGFISFDYKSVNYYKINQNGKGIQILATNDNFDAFLPDTLDNLLISVDDNKDNILNFIDVFDGLYNSKNQIKEIDGECIKTENNKLLISIENAKLMLQKKGGKIIVINSTCSWCDVVKQKNKVNSTFKYNANVSSIYKTFDTIGILESLGKSLSKYQISCDIFQVQINKTEKQNILTLKTICDCSSGKCYYLKNFHPSIHGKSFFYQLIKIFSVQRAFECLIGLNYSNELTFTKMLTPIPYHEQNTIILPNIDKDQTFSFLFEYSSPSKSSKGKGGIVNYNGGNMLNTNTKPFYYFQFFVIFTNLEGTRLIRIINKKIQVTHNILDYYKYMDIESSVVLIVKLFIEMLQNKTAVNNDLSNCIATTVQLYFSYALSNLKEQKITEMLSQLVMCFLGTMKSKFFCPDPTKHKINIDSLHYMTHIILKSSINDVMIYLMPRIYDITPLLLNEDSIENIMMNPIQLSKEYIKADKVLLVDNGQFLNLYFTKGEQNDIRIKDFFGEEMTFTIVGTYFHSEDDVFEGEKSFEVEKCKEMIDFVRNQKMIYMELFFSFEGCLSENLIKDCLIIDGYCSWFNYSYKDYYRKI